jgi:hypothetical protein
MDRAQRNVPFRILAKKFAVSVWTAHRLCAGRVLRWCNGGETVATKHPCGRRLTVLPRVPPVMPKHWQLPTN